MSNEIPEQNNGTFEKTDEGRGVGDSTTSFESGDGIGVVDTNETGWAEVRRGSFSGGLVTTPRRGEKITVTTKDNPTVYTWSGKESDVVGGWSPPARNVGGIAYDGSHLFTAHNGNGVYKWDLNGTQVNSFAVSEQINNLAWDGSSFWGAQGTYLYEFDTNFTVLSQLDLTPISFEEGLAWDGNLLWGPGSSTGSKNYMYGVDKNANLRQTVHHGQAGRRDPAWNGDGFWLPASGPSYIYEYDRDWDLVGGFEPEIGGDTQHIAWTGGKLFVTEYGGYVYELDGFHSYETRELS